MAEAGLQVRSSILAADGLAERVLARYGLAAPVRCRLVSRSLNDTYRVEAGNGVFYLRVSPHGTRTRRDVEAEVAWIADLHGRGLRVARALPRDDGGLVGTIEAPEGERCVVLFAVAEGTDARDITTAQASAYGRLAARVHDAADDAPNAYARFHLDERHLLDEPMAAIRATMADCGEDLAFLEATVERVRARLGELPRASPAYGLCHGDLHPGNVRFDAAGEPTLLDFDCAGYGWRVYDVTVFLWNIFGERRPKAWREGRWRAFLRGYREVRTLAPEELEAVPLFLVARQVWLTGLDCEGRSDWLPQWLTPGWFKETVGAVRRWVAEYPILRD